MLLCRGVVSRHYCIWGHNNDWEKKPWLLLLWSLHHSGRGQTFVNKITNINVKWQPLAHATQERTWAKKACNRTDLERLRSEGLIEIFTRWRAGWWASSRQKEQHMARHYVTRQCARTQKVTKWRRTWKKITLERETRSGPCRSSQATLRILLLI